jgi:hypothetical protein
MAAEGSHEAADERRKGRLRSAMLNDGQPWLVWWLPLPGVALAALWAAYAAISGGDEAGIAFVRTLAWPGLPIFLATTVTTYFGWRLDLD